MVYRIGVYNMTIKLNTKSGGGALRLAPDLSAIGNYDSGNNVFTVISGIDASAGLTTALSLTGRFAVDWLRFDFLTAESNTFKLTIDGVVIFNETVLTPTAQSIIGQLGSSTSINDGSYLVQDSLLLEVQTTTDNSIELQYLARPIL
jgi:exopolysaccharide biosynthesis protein